MESNLNKQIRQFIKQKRLAMGLTQSDLAIAVYKDQSRRFFLSNLENGNETMSLTTASRILSALNCRIEIIEN